MDISKLVDRFSAKTEVHIRSDSIDRTSKGSCCKLPYLNFFKLSQYFGIYNVRSTIKAEQHHHVLYQEIFVKKRLIAENAASQVLL